MALLELSDPCVAPSDEIAQPVVKGPVHRYWHESRRPLVSLVFVLPLLACYEIGVATLGSSAVRNGADAWLRQVLDLAGFGQCFLLPLLTIAALVAWHHTTHEPWRFSRDVLPTMAVEAGLLAAALVGFCHLQQQFAEQLGPVTHGRQWIGLIKEASPAPADAISRAIGFLGAGCYEELLFRLMLMPLTWGGLKLVGLGPRFSLIGAALVSSALFSAAHFCGATGEAWSVFGFAFRLLAGMFFAALFVLRGFGIVAGAHALYDIFVGVY